MNAVSNVIFDLDGTLIDSAPSILWTYKKVLELYSCVPLVPLGSELIGPPLHETMHLISGESDSKKILRLVEAFKFHYDNEAYTHCNAYDGISEMLYELFNADITLYIATNKRLAPTQKLLQYFEWEKYFQGIYTIDRLIPSYTNKSSMIRCLISDLGLKSKNCVYIGDRIEDYEAANHNSISFIFAHWGYGSRPKEIQPYQTAETPRDVLNYLKNLSKI